MLNSFRRLFSNPQNRKARRVFGLPRPELLSLEQRINPATFTYDSVSEALTIDLNTTNEVLTLTSQGNGAYVFTSTNDFTGTNTAGLTGNNTRTLTITIALNLTDVVITDSVAGTDVSFGTNSGAYVDNFSITLNAVGESVVTVANATAFSGAAGLNVAAARNIVISANLSTATGNIVLDADNGVQQTGNFSGVDIDGVFGAEVTTTGGNITIEGRGGDNTGGNQIGVWVFGAKVQAGGTGTVSVTGTGGAASGGRSDGVLVESPGSIITSSGGSVTVIGTGGGTGASTGNNNYGLKVDNLGNISAGGTGTVSVTGTGGAGTSPGIILTAANITTNTSGAAVTLTADSMAFDATSVVSSTGTVTLQNKTAGVAIDLGTETAGQLSLTDAELDRVTAGTLVIGRDDAFLSGAITVSNAISRAAGNLTLLGRNIEITADLSTVTGNIVLDADNSVQQPGGFIGVNISGTGVEVTTTGGNITIAGRGGDDSNNNQFGVYVQNGAKVQAGNNGSIFGTVSVTGTGGAAGGDFNYGVNVDGANSKITSSGGLVTIIGNGGGTGATGGGTAATSDNNRGVEVDNGGEISAGGTGTVSVTGTGGAAGGDFNMGVRVQNTGSIITSSGGSVTVIGNGGGTSVSGNNRGVRVFNGGKISAGLMGNVSVTGTGGATGGDDNYGVNVDGANSIITSSGGSVTIIGNGGGTGASAGN